jgi:lysine 2,3-aminomutase
MSPDPRAPWQEQLADAITTADRLAALIHLTPEEREGIQEAGALHRFRITPYYAALMDLTDPRCPIRRQAIPSTEELHDPLGTEDPLGEGENEPAPNLIRLYPDRVAWCVTATCPVYCRFCFRRRIVGQDGGDYSAQAREQSLAWISSTPAIRDVLVTGGDPLMLPDHTIDGILSRLRAIPHVEIIRIGTRAPVTLPQRITSSLCEILKAYHPLWINTHFNHARELTPTAIAACARLADAGIPLGNQSVLLKGVNDSLPAMRALSHGLVRARVRPYYLFQCHLTRGTAHFRTTVETGRDLMSGLRGSTTGFAVPSFVVDTPLGKIAVNPDTVVDRDQEAIYLRGWDGRVWREPNPAGGARAEGAPKEPPPGRSPRGNDPSP